MGRCAPEAAQAEVPGAEGIEHLLLAAFKGSGPPRLPRASQAPGFSVGQVPGQLRSGLSRCPRSGAECPAGAAASPRIQLCRCGWQRRALLGGCLVREPCAGEGRGELQPPPPAQTKEGRGEQARSWGRAQGCGSFSLRIRSPCCARSPWLSGLGPGPRQPEAVRTRWLTGALNARWELLSLGDRTPCPPFPGAGGLSWKPKPRTLRSYK